METPLSNSSCSSFCASSNSLFQKDKIKEIGGEKHVRSVTYFDWLGNSKYDKQQVLPVVHLENN